ncbi:hypothetical protein Mapa_015273 [Marchantia paleacea]|nr:hypothetical protein Mapa_015273 [Marchantia paleacea]
MAPYDSRTDFLAGGHGDSLAASTARVALRQLGYALLWASAAASSLSFNLCPLHALPVHMTSHIRIPSSLHSALAVTTTPRSQPPAGNMYRGVLGDTHHHPGASGRSLHTSLHCCG